MGRYYSGDINGKFWFALQSSNAADRFGVIGVSPDIISYYFSKEDLPSVEEELKSIEEYLGNKLEILNDFFSRENFYNDEDITKLGVTNEELSEYADYNLGIKIRDCINKIEQCEFEAEL